MRTRWLSSIWLVIAILGLWLAVPAAGAKEGFGLTKKAAQVTRVNPPKVFLMGTRIQVRASGQGASQSEAAQRLQARLESELLSADSRLTAEAVRPETLVEVTILRSEGSEHWEKKRMLRRKKVGTDSKGNPIYQEYEVDVPFKTVAHSFSAAYKVSDVVKGLNLDADTVAVNFSQSFMEGSGAPELFSLEETAIRQLVSTVVLRVTPSKEVIGVLLPKGSLEDLAKLGEAGLWNKYLETLEALPPRPKPADESYRQYALGAAYEALAYAAEDVDTTLKYLEQASAYYNSALEANPGEKFFSKAYDSFWSSKSAPAPLERVQSALVSYRRIKEFQESYAKMQAAKESVVAGKGASPAAMEGNVNNASIIQMVKSGVPDDIILTAIDSAVRCEFDVSPQGLIQLTEAKVSKPIIQRMQKAANRKPAPKPASSKKSGNP